MQLNRLYCFTRMVFLLIICFAMCPADLSADIYSYMDKDGVLHYTNAPASSKYQYTGPEISQYASIAFSGSRFNKFDHIIKEASDLHGIRFELLKAMIQVESNFNPNAISKSGAIGLMQIMPGNLKEFKLSDPFDPRENVMAGTRYVKHLMKRFDSDLSLTLAAYNAGPGAVDKHQSIPPYPETENYVKKVLTHYNYYINQRP
jgi:soluble lytic murein transglycosylase-like protein